MRHATAVIDIFTFKEGLLAGVGHDMRLRLDRAEIELEGETIRARVPLAGLVVEGAVRDGVVQPAALDARQRADIERAARQDVLRVARHPTAEFTGTAKPAQGGFDVRGTLALAGRSAPLACRIDGAGPGYQARFTLRPSTWGIAPYRALLGALRLQDRVDLALTVTETPPA